MTTMLTFEQFMVKTTQFIYSRVSSKSSFYVNSNTLSLRIPKKGPALSYVVIVYIDYLIWKKSEEFSFVLFFLSFIFFRQVIHCLTPQHAGLISTHNFFFYFWKADSTQNIYLREKKRDSEFHKNKYVNYTGRKRSTAVQIQILGNQSRRAKERRDKQMDQNSTVIFGWG